MTTSNHEADGTFARGNDYAHMTKGPAAPKKPRGVRSFATLLPVGFWTRYRIVRGGGEFALVAGTDGKRTHVVTDWTDLAGIRWLVREARKYGLKRK